jgi:hypothetical protein
MQLASEFVSLTKAQLALVNHNRTRKLQLVGGLVVLKKEAILDG